MLYEFSGSAGLVLPMNQEAQVVLVFFQTVQQFLNTMNSTIAKMSNGSQRNEVWDASAMAFDAMWLSAIGLNNTAAKLRGLNKSLVSSDRELRRQATETLGSSLMEVDFQGLSVSGLTITATPIWPHYPVLTAYDVTMDV